jgi:hypothetical protein
MKQYCRNTVLQKYSTAEIQSCRKIVQQKYSTADIKERGSL